MKKPLSLHMKLTNKYPYVNTPFDSVIIYYGLIFILVVLTWEMSVISTYTLVFVLRLT